MSHWQNLDTGLARQRHQRQNLFGVINEQQRHLQATFKGRAAVTFLPPQTAKLKLLGSDGQKTRTLYEGSKVASGLTSRSVRFTSDGEWQDRHLHDRTRHTHSWSADGGNGDANRQFKKFSKSRLLNFRDFVVFFFAILWLHIGKKKKIQFLYRHKRPNLWVRPSCTRLHLKIDVKWEKTLGKIQPLYTSRKLYRPNDPSARWLVCWEKEAFNQWPVLASDELRVLLRRRQVAHQAAFRNTIKQTKKKKTEKRHQNKLSRDSARKQLGGTSKKPQSLEF